MKVGKQTQQILLEVKLEAFTIQKQLEQLLSRLAEQPATKQNQKVLAKALKPLKDFILQ